MRLLYFDANGSGGYPSCEYRWGDIVSMIMGLARLVEIKLVLGLFPWNTRAALSSVLGGEKIAQVFEVFDSLTQARHFGGEFPQRRLLAL